MSDSWVLVCRIDNDIVNCLKCKQNCNSVFNWHYWTMAAFSCTYAAIAPSHDYQNVAKTLGFLKVPNVPHMNEIKCATRKNDSVIGVLSSNVLQTGQRQEHE